MKGSDLTKQENKNNISKLLIILIIFIILFFIISIIFFCRTISFYKHEKNFQNGVNITVDPNAEYEHTPVRGVAEEKGVAIWGKAVIKISAGTKEAAVDFYNPKENAGLYCMTFELKICSDNGTDYETIYTSGSVGPGKHIYNITLSRELEKGTYDAIIHVQPYRIGGNHSPTNNADIKTELVVE